MLDEKTRAPSADGFSWYANHEGQAMKKICEGLQVIPDGCYADVKAQIIPASVGFEKEARSAAVAAENAALKARDDAIEALSNAEMLYFKAMTLSICVDAAILDADSKRDNALYYARCDRRIADRIARGDPFSDVFKNPFPVESEEKDVIAVVRAAADHAAREEFRCPCIAEAMKKRRRDEELEEHERLEQDLLHS